MEAFLAVLLFAPKPPKMLWMMFKMLRPHVRVNAEPISNGRPVPAVIRG